MAVIGRFLDTAAMKVEIEPSAHTEESPQGNHWKVTLLSSSEGRILLIGVAVALVYSLYLAISVLVRPEETQVLIAVTAMAAMFGRAAGLLFGYDLGLGHATVVPIAMVVETVFVLIVYPLFVLGWQHLLVVKPLKNAFDRIHRAAEARRGTIQRYGIIGLFAFVWFPFWMTGPVVGSVIGFMLGLPAWLNMSVVLGGTYAAIVTWAFFLRHVRERVASYNSYAPIILVAVIIIIVIAGHLLQRTLHENRNKE
jgi:uncharacterized membrane protein